MIKRKRNRGLTIIPPKQDKMNDSILEEGHTNMMTTIPGTIGLDLDMEDDLVYNNDFVGKNKNMQTFFV